MLNNLGHTVIIKMGKKGTGTSKAVKGSKTKERKVNHDHLSLKSNSSAGSPPPNKHQPNPIQKLEESAPVNVAPQQADATIAPSTATTATTLKPFAMPFMKPPIPSMEAIVASGDPRSRRKSETSFTA